MVKKSIVFTVLLISILTVVAVNAIPEGAQIAQGRTETRAAPSADTVVADGGNVTEVNVSASTQTLRWQGFFGQVNGSLVLQDNSGDTFYAWNLTNTSGEVYASADTSVNFAAINPNNNCSIDNPKTGSDLVDSGNNTYSFNNSREITVGSILINASTACAANPYTNGIPQSDNFHDIILTDDLNFWNSTPDNLAGGNTSIYATLIESDITGYDGGSYDYQLLVPINTSTGFETYTFYAELG